MEVSFSMDDCKFYVNQEKRIIVCTLDHTKDMFINYFLDVLHNNSIYIEDTLYNNLIMPNHFTGIAKCSEEDTWNEDLGRKIAYLRLREKVWRSFFKRAKTYVDTVDNWLEHDMQKINMLGQKLDTEMENRNNYIAERLSKNA